MVCSHEFAVMSISSAMPYWAPRVIYAGISPVPGTAEGSTGGSAPAIARYSAILHPQVSTQFRSISKWAHHFPNRCFSFVYILVVPVPVDPRHTDRGVEY